MRAQNFASNPTAPSAGYQPRNDTTDARRAASAFDESEHCIPHTALRQMRIQPSIETPPGPVNEQQNDYIGVQSFNQTPFKPD
jgi:hypothetical protein